MDVMLDLETLGTSPGSVIASIGAVAFDPRGGVGPTFFCGVGIANAQACGLKIDAATVEFWLQQTPESIAATFLDTQRMKLVEALSAFSNFCAHTDVVNIWSHGACFDVPMMEAAYRRCGMKAPWDFRNIRDTRTVLDLAGGSPIARHKDAIAHHALDDAWFQAQQMIACYQKLGVR